MEINEISVIGAEEKENKVDYNVPTAISVKNLDTKIKKFFRIKEKQKTISISINKNLYHKILEENKTTDLEKENISFILCSIINEYFYDMCDLNLCKRRSEFFRYIFIRYIFDKDKKEYHSYFPCCSYCGKRLKYSHVYCFSKKNNKKYYFCKKKHKVKFFTISD